MEKPILFSTEMVKAILEGRKTQTRRIIKSKHESGLFRICRRVTDNVITSIESLDWDERNCEKDITCPYGKVGDSIYVREEHYQKGKWVMDGQTKTGKQKWKFVATHPAVLFDNNKPALFEKSRDKRYPEAEMWYKRLARFMPKSAARIWLEITEIRVERLQEIKPTDAIAEGILQDELGFKNYDKKAAMGYGDPDHDWPHLCSPVDSFQSLWQSINGEQSWNENPWVWVIRFEVLSSTGKPEQVK